MNTKTWYTLTHTLSKLGRARQYVLLGAKVKVDPKSRSLFEYFRRHHKAIVDANGEGVVSKQWREIGNQLVEILGIGIGTTFIALDRRVGPVRAGMWDEWKVYIDDDIAAKVFLHTFKDNNDV